LLFVPRIGKQGDITTVVTPVSSTNAKFQELPPPTGKSPYHLELSKAFPIMGGNDGNRDGIVFHVVGDTGDRKNPWPAGLVELAMEADIEKSKPGRKAMFLYHVGDVVYKFGEASEYYSQFYEPYAHYPAPIFAIPGNKDGDVRPGNNVRSLDAFVKNFCARQRGIVTTDALEIPRDAMIQPNVYWTLDAPLVTIVGLYSNVPDGGVIKEDQFEWFKHELENAPQNKALIVAVHHPSFSVDEEHSGSDVMLKLLDKAFKSTDRFPDMIVSGHVHNYQRFTRRLDKHYIPYLVIGNGGHFKLHRMQYHLGARIKTPYKFGHNITLEKYVDDAYGFLRVRVTRKKIITILYALSTTSNSRVADRFEIDLRSHEVSS
jgi:acid phosphatase type 7